MTILEGKGASRGLAMGPVCICRPAAPAVCRRAAADAAAEQARFDAARAEASRQLEALHAEACAKAGEKSAEVFEIHRMMLDDEDYRQCVAECIRTEGVNAEWAVQKAGERFSALFSEMEDAYMKERAADVRDISARLIRVLTGAADETLHTAQPVVLAAQDLSPSETVRLDKQNILAFLTAGGSASSHTAILARTMGIPAVVHLGPALAAALDAADGICTALVDGGTGRVVLDPDEQTAAAFAARMRAEAEARSRREALRGLPAVTKDGRRVLLYANIGSAADAQAAVAADAEGVGLFRTEFVYLGSADYPTEEEQYRVYRDAVTALAGRRLIFRTLDIGADKQAAYFGLPHEENPAMGLRAIRLCLTRPELLHTQLRAIYRAGAGGKIGIMFPMIASEWELLEARKMCAQVCAELAAEGAAFAPDAELGVMIETPAAVMISAALAQHADFFSIGTNDLTQYTLAIDRQNPDLGRFCDTHHPAVLEMIRMTAENAHRGGAWCGICGELAADTALTETFLRDGVDELSVSPPAVLPLREKVRSLAL